MTDTNIKQNSSLILPSVDINRIMEIMLDSYKDVRSNVALQEYFKTHTGKISSL